MFFGKRPTGIALGLGLIGATLTSGAMADSFTGKANAVCAAVSVIACTDKMVCMQGNAHTFELPAFMFIDVKKNTIRAADASMKGYTSPIKTKEITDTSVILQGYENHRGWTAAIDRTDGSLNLSSTGPDVNFMITGNCTAL
ncbi:MAG: hypothetical protein ABJ308_16515 [Halieaceae bacterium]